MEDKESEAGREGEPIGGDVTELVAGNCLIPRDHRDCAPKSKINSVSKYSLGEKRKNLFFDSSLQLIKPMRC